MDLEQLLLNRCSMYGFLARLYRTEVDQEFLDQMSEMDLSMEVDVPEIRDGYRMLRDYLDRPGETIITDLAVDYARVFLGAGQGEKNGAYPYESVYTSEERLVMQEARDQVLKLYREEGLERSEAIVEPEDHLSLELEFMAHLCRRAAEAMNAGDHAGALDYLQKQQQFLDQHLLAWVPAFCDDVQRLARESFYQAVAKITAGYLGMERELIADLTDVVQEECKD
jgi:TorA maturation chaperone TorD